MLADIGRAREDLMHGGDTPATAVAGADVALVEIGGYRLDAQRACVAVAVERQSINQAHRVGVDRINLQLLLDLCPALLGSDDPVTDRRQRPIPVALTRIL